MSKATAAKMNLGEWPLVKARFQSLITEVDSILTEDTSEEGKQTKVAAAMNRAFQL